MLMFVRFILRVWGTVGREHRDLALENIALRHQLEVLTRTRRRPGLQPSDRLFWSVLFHVWPEWRRQLVIVQPVTVVRWHRSAWRAYWTWRSRAPRRGRPRIDVAIAAAIRKMTKRTRAGDTCACSASCASWASARACRQCAGIGRTCRATRCRAGAPSSRIIAQRSGLRTFSRCTRLFFQTLYIFFLIAHDRRTLTHVSVTAHPSAPWVWRQLIDATPWGAGPRFLIRDRDRSYGGDFVARTKRIGISTVLTPIATPQANGIAERLVGTFRRECLDHIIIVNERHLRFVREFSRHYDGARPHQALDLEIPGASAAPPDAPPGPVVGHPVLGGLTHEYERLSA